MFVCVCVCVCVCVYVCVSVCVCPYPPPSLVNPLFYPTTPLYILSEARSVVAVAVVVAVVVAGCCCAAVVSVELLQVCSHCRIQFYTR